MTADIIKSTMETPISTSSHLPNNIRIRLAASLTWQKLIQWLRQHESPRWVFRGQMQQWSLRPAIGRYTNSFDPARELQLFDEFRRLASPFVDRAAVLNDWDWLFVAQHHGLPTRLLDWSTNPLVSVYFACQSSARGKRDGVLYAVQPSIVGTVDALGKAAGPFALSSTTFVYPTAVAARISSQRGLFSVHAQPQNSWIIRKGSDRFVIPAAHKEFLLGYLAGLGVDAAMVMADLDGLASNLRWRYRTGLAIR